MTPAGAAAVFALLALAAAGAAAGLRPARAADLAAGATLLAAAAFAAAWAAGAEPIVDAPWLPVLGSRLVLALDPLAAPLAVFATGLAAVVLLYTAGYLPRHLAHHGRPAAEQARFCRLMLLFVGAMVLLLIAQDLLVVFAALELTALASFLLIEFDRAQRAARRAAMLALVVTAGSSLLFLLGLLLIALEHGTTVIAELGTQTPSGAISSASALCLVVGVLAKSAQVPLHFWLPRAMVAPTPVSAYLHSAALVAAGVFTLQRVRPLLEPHAGVLLLLEIIGFVSIAVGGVLALASDHLKRILAYSTIAQYGYCTVLIAAGGAAGAVGAPFFLIAHGSCKCALFMAAGAVTAASGAHRLSAAGGLGRRMPWIAAASAVAAAGLAGLPGTIGYAKDDLLFAAALERGPAAAALATAAGALTVAYIGRFWLGIFAGPARSAGGEGAHAGARLAAPIAVLAAAVVVGGLWTGPLGAAFAEAGSVVARRPVAFDLGLPGSLTAETWMGITAWTAGLGLLALHRPAARALRRLRAAIAPLGPARWADLGGAAVDRLSERMHAIERADLRDRLGVTMLATAAFVVAALVGEGFAVEAGALGWPDVTVAAGLAVTAAAALASARARQHVTLVLMLSFVGYGLALTFALSGAPEVALVVALVETTLTILFLALLARLRSDPLARAGATERRGPWAGAVGALAAFCVAWIAISSPAEETIAHEIVRRADQAHARDVVTAILADFRGLDTAVEVTVFAVAVLGAATISWGRDR